MWNAFMVAIHYHWKTSGCFYTGAKWFSLLKRPLWMHIIHMNSINVPNVWSHLLYDQNLLNFERSGNQVIRMPYSDFSYVVPPGNIPMKILSTFISMRALAISVVWYCAVSVEHIIVIELKACAEIAISKQKWFNRILQSRIPVFFSF